MKTETAAKTLLRVLLVEDSSADEALIVRELRTGEYGFNVPHVDSLPRLEEDLTQNSFDIVIFNYHFPRFTALDVLSVTHSPKRDLNEGLALGAVEFIQHPIDPGLLIENIERALARWPEQQE